MATTHAVMAIAGCCFFLGDSSWLMLTLAMVGSQIPDIDTTGSVFGRILYPVAAWIEARYAHRTVTHSINCTLGLIAIAAVPWILFGFHWRYAVAIPLAHLLSCIGDTLTKTGVAWFWPNPARVVFTRNPNRRIETGTSSEYVLLVGLVMVGLVATDINTSGGLWISVTQMLGTPNAVEAVMNQSGSSHHIWVTIDGTMASDRNPIKGKFFVIDQSGAQRFVIQNRQGIYETGAQILPRRMQSETGSNAMIRERVIALNDQPLLDSLVDLYYDNPESAIYLSGTITVDAPEEMQVMTPPSQLDVMAKTGNSIVLNYCPIEQLGQIATHQWATGQLVARIIYPQPVYE